MKGLSQRSFDLSNRVDDVDTEMATPERLELSTSSLEGWRSIQLSYGVFPNSSKNFNGSSSEVLLDDCHWTLNLLGSYFAEKRNTVCE